MHLKFWNFAPPPREQNFCFLWLGEKDEIYARRSMLGKFFNPENSRPITIKERLPQKDRELKQMAEKKGYITSTKNCQVKVFYKTQEGFLRSCDLNKEQLDNGNSFIVRQRKRQFAQHTKDSEFNNNTSQVSQTNPSNVCLRNVIPQAPNISKSTLKRLRLSPN